MNITIWNSRLTCTALPWAAITIALLLTACGSSEKTAVTTEQPVEIPDSTPPAKPITVVATTTAPTTSAPTTTTSAAPTTTTLPPMTPLELAVYESTGQLPGEGNVRVITSPDDINELTAENGSTEPIIYADRSTDDWIDFFEAHADCVATIRQLNVPRSQSNSFVCERSAPNQSIYALSMANGGDVDWVRTFLTNTDPDGPCWALISHVNWIFALTGQGGTLVESDQALADTLLAEEGTVLDVPCGITT